MKENPDTSADKKRRNMRSEGSHTSDEPESKMHDDKVDKAMVISPELPKEFIHIVRPSYPIKENSIRALTSKLATTVIDRADETISSIKQAAGTSEKGAASKEVAVPVTQKQLSPNKRDVHDVVSIEKRWATKKIKIDVPVGYENVFVDNQELRFGIGEALTEMKDRILEIVSIENYKEDNIEYTWVPLYGPDTEMQTEIPLYAEEIIISKRKVMIGKVVIRKRQVTKEQSIDAGW